MAVTSQDIAKLRAATGAGMMDCKNALEEAGGDSEKAGDILRKKGIVKAAKRSDKVASEGVVSSYIHAGGKVGVLLELNCETDFVARTEVFQTLAKDFCLHIAAANPQFVDRASVPPALIEKEKEIYGEQLKVQDKPQSVIDGIMKGKLEKFYEEMCLLDQPYVKDDTKKVEQVITAASVETGEKITIRRFVRYELGEGIEKEVKDFAAEVAAAQQIKK